MPEKFEMPHADKLVGVPTEYADKQEIAEKNFTKYFEQPSEREKPFELEKTEKDIEIINFCDESVQKYMETYGRKKNIKLPMENIHVLQEGGVEAVTEGRLRTGSHSTIFGKIAVDRNPSDTQFSLVAFHELFHTKAYQAGQIKTKEGDFKMGQYRSGFIVTSRDGKRTYFNDVEEAVVGHMTQRFFDEILSKDPKYIPEIEERNKNGQSFDISRKSEQASGEKLAEDLFVKNTGNFANKEEIMEMFIKAQVTGNILPVARLFEKTYGKGSFRKLGEETGTVEKVEEKDK